MLWVAVEVLDKEVTAQHVEIQVDLAVAVLKLRLLEAQAFQVKAI
jgi:hypothetical protein